MTDARWRGRREVCSTSRRGMTAGWWATSRTSRFICRTRASGGLGKFTFEGGFFAIEDLVGGAEELIDGLAVVGIDGYSGTHGDGWLVAVGSEPFGNSIGNAQSGLGFRFRKNKHEFVPTVTRSGVNGAAMNAKNISQATDGFAAHEMAVGVIDLFQAVQIEQHD